MGLTKKIEKNQRSDFFGIFGISKGEWKKRSKEMFNTRLLRGRRELDQKFSFKISSEDLDKLIEYADRRDSAVSQAARELIKLGLEASENRGANRPHIARHLQGL